MLRSRFSRFYPARFLLLLTVCLLVLGVTAPPAQAVHGLSTREKQMLTLLNRERTKRGLRPLTADSTLNRLAYLKSKDMVQRRYFSHISPTYGHPYTMLKRYRVPFRTFGENIGQGRSVTTIHYMFMASPSHRSAILNRTFNRVGIGIVSGPGSGITVTELFVGR